jgi:hypothetical protein
VAASRGVCGARSFGDLRSGEVRHDLPEPRVACGRDWREAARVRLLRSRGRGGRQSLAAVDDLVRAARLRRRLLRIRATRGRPRVLVRGVAKRHGFDDGAHRDRDRRHPDRAGPRRGLVAQTLRRSGDDRAGRGVGRIAALRAAGWAPTRSSRSRTAITRPRKRSCGARST